MLKYFISFISTLVVCSCSFAKKDEKIIEANDIIKQIEKGKSIHLLDKIIMGDLDFTQVDKSKSVDGNGVLKHRIENDITFVNCVFMDKVKAYSKKGFVVNQTQFKGDVSFRNCDFRNSVDFTDAVVDGTMVLSQSKFREDANFNFLHVKGGNLQMWELLAEKALNMENVKVPGRINGIDCKFVGAVSFQGLDCYNLQLGNLEADTIFNLSLATIRGNVMMNYARVHSDFIMEGSTIFKDFICVKSSFSKLYSIEDIRVMGKCSFKESSFDEELNMKNSIFDHEPDFESCVIPNDLRYNVKTQKVVEKNKNK